MRHLFVGLFLVFFHPISTAVVLYDNGVATGDSDRCAETSGACTGEWTVFDDFTLANDSTIESISWTARLYQGASDYNASNISIYDADPVFDGGNLLYSASSVGVLSANALGSDFFDIVVSGLSEVLSAGTYWLGMQNDTTAGFGTIARVSATNGSTGTQWQNDGTGSRLGNPLDFSFKLEGRQGILVSAPATIWLFGFFIVGLMAKKKKS